MSDEIKFTENPTYIGIEDLASQIRTMRHDFFDTNNENYLSAFTNKVGLNSRNFLADELSGLGSELHINRGVLVGLVTIEFLKPSTREFINTHLKRIEAHDEAVYTETDFLRPFRSRLSYRELDSRHYQELAPVCISLMDLYETDTECLSSNIAKESIKIGFIFGANFVSALTKDHADWLEKIKLSIAR